ncbi:regulator of G-protein signaling 13 [Rhinophrynus dorsalis]
MSKYASREGVDKAPEQSKSRRLELLAVEREASTPGRTDNKKSAAGTKGSISLEEVLQWSESFEKLMSTQYGPAVYTAYLKTEYSDENIEFWFACESYKNITSRWKRMVKAKKLFKRYIKPNSPREINIDSPTREALAKEIHRPTPNSFDEAQLIVLRHMERDSYPRFLTSSFYQKLISNLETENVINTL